MKTIIVMIIAWAGMALGQPVSQAQKDSGWVSLFDGTTLDGFYTQFGTKIDTMPKSGTSAFSVRASDTSIAATGNPIGIITTKKNYGHYRVRCWMKFGNTGNSEDNAGLLYHVQKGSPLLFGLYPRSVEFQGQKRGTGETWTIGNVWLTIRLAAGGGTPKYSPTGTEGEVGNPQGRQCLGSSVPYKDGQWNLMDLTVRGSDSSIHSVNGTVTLKARRIRWSQADSPTDMATPLASGGISFQSEGAPVAYKQLMIMELDPLTGRPLNAKPVLVQPVPHPTLGGLKSASNRAGLAIMFAGEAGSAGNLAGFSLFSLDGRMNARLPKAAQGAFILRPDSQR